MNVLILLVLLNFAVGVVGTIWVFGDAVANSSGSASLWGAVTLFGGFTGIALYALLGRDEKSSGGTAEQRMPVTHRCESCGETYRANPSTEIDTCRSCGGVRVHKV